jgi:hypothetical protein
MISIEFHCHTRFSKDSLLPPEKLVDTCRRKGLSRVVVTDHNSIAGARQAQAYAPDLVIVGEEIMTTQGELLAAFVREEIPRGLPPQEAIARLREQGAFISVSHPFDQLRNGHWQPEHLTAILPLVDAIETFNARCMSADFNRRAQEFAVKMGIPGTAGSDAHAAFELGRARMHLPDFNDAEGLRGVIAQARFQARLSSPFVHFTSRYAVWKKARDARLAETGTS